MRRYRVDWSSIPWESPAPGVRFNAYRRGGRQLRLVEFSKGFVEPDWCAKGHIGYVLEGRGEIDFNGSVVLFNRGDGIFIPPGEEHKHKLKALTDVVRVVLVEDA